MDWKKCLKKSIAKETLLDEDLINSLIDASEGKLKANEELKMNEIMAGPKVSLMYR